MERNSPSKAKAAAEFSLLDCEEPLHKKYHANTALKRNSFYDAVLDELEECIPARDTVESEFDAKALGAALDRFLSTLDGTNMGRYWFAQSIKERV